MIGTEQMAPGKAMVWELGFREGEFIPELNMNWRWYYMTNDAGVKIEQTGASGPTRSCIFLYTSKDIRFEFSAGIPAGSKLWLRDWDGNIGPVCDVLIFSHALSRPVSAAEGKEIADILVSFLLEYRRFPRAIPPFPERVTFKDITKGTLKL